MFDRLHERLLRAGIMLFVFLLIAPAPCHAQSCSGAWLTTRVPPKPFGWVFQASVIPGGDVFVHGMFNSFGDDARPTSSMLYSPQSDRWSRVEGILDTAYTNRTGQLYPSGGEASPTANSTQFFDPGRGRWFYSRTLASWGPTGIRSLSDGRFVISSIYDGLFAIWNPETDAIEPLPPLEGFGINDFFVLSSDRIAVQVFDCGLGQCDPRPMRVLNRLTRQWDEWPASASIQPILPIVAPDGSLIAVAQTVTTPQRAGNAVYRLSPMTGAWTRLGAAFDPASSVPSILPLRNGDVLAVVQGRGAPSTYCWRATTDQWEPLVVSEGAVAGFLCELNDGRVFAISGGGGSTSTGAFAAIMIDLATGESVAVSEPAGGRAAVTALTCDPTGGMVCGGLFTEIDGTPASNIARFNEMTARWEPIGEGLDFQVGAITALSNGDLIVSTPSSATDAPGTGMVRWRAATGTWIGTNANLIFSRISVLAMVTLRSGDVVAGGRFTVRTTNATPVLARWSPATNRWSPIVLNHAGSTLSDTNVVEWLDEYAPGTLIATGRFQWPGLNSLRSIARIDIATGEVNAIGESTQPEGILKACSLDAGDLLAIGDVRNTTTGEYSPKIVRYFAATDRWSQLDQAATGFGRIIRTGDGNLFAIGDVVRKWVSVGQGGPGSPNDSGYWQSLGTLGETGFVLAVSGTPDGGLLVGGTLMQIDRRSSEGLIRWVPVCPCGRADIAKVGGGEVADGQLTPDDLILFLHGFVTQRGFADLAGTGGALGGDGGWTADDVIAFFAAFFAGCS